MITFGSVYLIVKDFQRSLAFYTDLLGKGPVSQNMERFAIFSLDGLSLCLYNAYFDRENPDKVVRAGEAWAVYDDTPVIAEKPNPGKAVLNLTTDDLQKEYERAAHLGRDITPIRYINARSPYYYFSMKDPDGNPIEITGEWAGGPLQ